MAGFQRLRVLDVFLPSRVGKVVIFYVASSIFWRDIVATAGDGVLLFERR